MEEIRWKKYFIQWLLLMDESVKKSQRELHALFIIMELIIVIILEIGAILVQQIHAAKEIIKFRKRYNMPENIFPINITIVD